MHKPKKKEPPTARTSLLEILAIVQGKTVMFEPGPAVDRMKLDMIASVASKALARIPDAKA